MIGKAFITGSGKDLAGYLRYGQNRTLTTEEKAEVYEGRVGWEEVKGAAAETTPERLIVETERQRERMQRGLNNKAYAHLIVAWPEDMSVSPENERETTLRYLDAMGLEGHGYYMVSHKDKPYHHTHTLVRRFSHERRRMVPFHNTHYKLWEVSRQIEEEQGRRRLPYTLNEYYEMERGLQRPDFSMGSKGSIRSRLSSIEQLRGVTDRLLRAGSWQDIDRLLQEEGYVMEPKRSGLVAIQQERDVAVAFSTVTPKLSHTKLADRFGETWHDWAMRQHEQAMQQRETSRAKAAAAITPGSDERAQTSVEALTTGNTDGGGRPPGERRTPQTKTVGTMAKGNSGATGNSGLTAQRRQEIMNWAANHYWMEARSLDEESSIPEDRTAAKYMNERGLRGDTGNSYKVGYAKDSNTWLRKEAAKKGITDDELIEAGLAYRGSASGKAVSKYRGRVMFPVTDSKGDVTTFSGRNVPGVEETNPPRVNPKYLEMGSSNLFDKNTALFGEQEAMQRGSKPLAVVEGYTDVTALRNREMYAVALGGAQPTTDQIDAIERVASKGDKNTVAVMLDGDEAGRKGTAKLVRGLTERGVRTIVVEMDEGQDPYALMEKTPEGDKTKAAVIRRTMSGAEYMATRGPSGESMEPDPKDPMVTEKRAEQSRRMIEGAVEASAMPRQDERARMMRQIESIYAQENGERSASGQARARYRFNQFVEGRLEDVKAGAPDDQREYYDRTIKEVATRRQEIAASGQVPTYALSSEDIEAGYGKDESTARLEDEIFSQPALSTKRSEEIRAQNERAGEMGALAGEGAAEEGPVASRDDAIAYGEEQSQERKASIKEKAGQETVPPSEPDVQALQEDVRKAIVDYRRVEAEADVVLSADQSLSRAATNEGLSPTDREAANELRSSLRDDANEAYARMDKSGQALDGAIERANIAGLEIEEDQLRGTVPAAEAALEGAEKGVEDLLARREADIQNIENSGGDVTGRRRAWEIASDAALEVEESAIGEVQRAKENAPAQEEEAAPKQTQATAPDQATAEASPAEAGEGAAEASAGPAEVGEDRPAETTVSQDARREEAVEPEATATPEATDTSKIAATEDRAVKAEQDEEASIEGATVQGATMEDGRSELQQLQEKAYAQRAEEAGLVSAMERIDVGATDMAGGYYPTEEEETVRESLVQELKDVRGRLEATEGEVSDLQETMRETYGPESIESIDIDRDKAWRQGINSAVDRIESAREFDTWEEDLNMGPSRNVDGINRVYDEVSREAEKTTKEAIESGWATPESSQAVDRDTSGQEAAETLRGREEVGPLTKAEMDLAEVQGRIALQERFRSDMSSEREALRSVTVGEREELSPDFKEKVEEQYGEWSVQGGWMANRASEFEAAGGFDKVTQVKLDGGRLAENQKSREYDTYWVVEQDGEKALVPALTAARGDRDPRPAADYFEQEAKGRRFDDGSAVEIKAIRYDLDDRQEARVRLGTVEDNIETSEARLSRLQVEERQAGMKVEGQRIRLEEQGLELPERVSRKADLEEARYKGAEKEAWGQGVRGGISEELKVEMRPALNNAYEEYAERKSAREAEPTSAEQNTSAPQADNTAEADNRRQSQEEAQTGGRATQDAAAGAVAGAAAVGAAAADSGGTEGRQEERTVQGENTEQGAGVQKRSSTAVEGNQRGATSKEGDYAETQSGEGTAARLEELQEELRDAQRGVAQTEGMAMTAESVRTTRSEAAIQYQANERGLEFGERDSFVEESRKARRYLDSQMEEYSTRMGERQAEFWTKIEEITSTYPDQDVRDVLLDEGEIAKERASGAKEAAESINRGMENLRENSTADQNIAEGAYPRTSVREEEEGLTIQVQEKGVGTGQEAIETEDTNAEVGTRQGAVGTPTSEVPEPLPDPVKEPVMLTRDGLIENDKRMITWEERQDAIANSPYEPTSGEMANAEKWEAQIERLTERLTPEDRDYLAEMNVSNPSKESDLINQRMDEAGPLPPSMEDGEVRNKATGTAVDPVVEREVLITQNTVAEASEGRGGDLPYETFRNEASGLIERAAEGEITAKELSKAIQDRSQDLSEEDQRWLNSRRAEVEAYESRPEDGIQTKEGISRRFKEDDMAPSDVDTLVSRVSGEEGELSREGFARVEQALDSESATAIGRQTQVRFERQSIDRLSKEAEAQLKAERLQDDSVMGPESIENGVPEQGPAVDDETAARMANARAVIATVDEKIDKGEEIGVGTYKDYRQSLGEMYRMNEMTAEEGAARVEGAKAQLSARNQEYIGLEQELEARLKKGMIRSTTYEQEKAILGEPEELGAGPGGPGATDGRGRQEAEYVGVDYEGERITVRARGLSDPEIEAQRELIYRYDADQGSPRYKEAVEIVDEMGGMGADQALNAVREGRDVRKVMAEYASEGAPATLQTAAERREEATYARNEAAVGKETAVEKEQATKADEMRPVASQETTQSQVSPSGTGVAAAAGAGGAAAGVAAAGMASGSGGGTGDETGGRENDGQGGATGQSTERRAVQEGPEAGPVEERFVTLNEMSERAKDMRAQVAYADNEVTKLREDAVVSKKEFEDVIRSTSTSPAKGEIAVAQFRADWKEKGYTRAVMDEVERSVERVNTMGVEERGSTVPDQEIIQRTGLEVIKSQKDAAVSTAYATDLRRSYANTVEAESTRVLDQERTSGQPGAERKGGRRTETEEGKGISEQGRGDRAGKGEEQDIDRREGQATEGSEGVQRTVIGAPGADAGDRATDGAGERGRSSAGRGDEEGSGRQRREQPGRTEARALQGASGDAEERGNADERVSGGDDAGELRREGRSRSADGDGQAGRGQEQGVDASPQQAGGSAGGRAGGSDREEQRSASGVDRPYGGNPGRDSSGRGPEQDGELSEMDSDASGRIAAADSRGVGTGLDPVAYRKAQPQARTPDEEVNLGRREFETPGAERPEAVTQVKREMREVREVGRVQQAYEVANEAEVRETRIRKLGQMNTALGDDTEGNMQRARIQFRRTLAEKGVDKVDVDRIAERFEQWNQRLGYRGSMYVLDQEIKKLEERPVGYTGIDTNVPSQTEGMSRYGTNSVAYAATRLSAAASVAQYQEDTGRASERQLLNENAVKTRTTLSEVYRNPREVIRNADRMIREATDKAKAAKQPGERWTAKDQTAVYRSVHKEMVEKPEQYGSLKPGVPQWEAKRVMKEEDGASMTVKTVDAKNRYRARLIYNERPQARDVMDIARERVDIDRAFSGLPAQDSARREFKNAYIRGLSEREVQRLGSEAETVNRDMENVQTAQSRFGKSLARQEAFDGQLDYLVAQRYERPEEAAGRIREAYRGALSMPDANKEGSQGKRPSMKREVMIGEGADAATYGQLKADPTPVDNISSVKELDTKINKAARLSVMQERVVQRAEKDLLNVADNITEVSKAVTRVDVQINEALGRREQGGQVVVETRSKEQSYQQTEVARTPVKTEVDPDIETERVARGTVNLKDVSPTVLKAANVNRSQLTKGAASVMTPTPLAVMTDKRVQKRVASMGSSAVQQTMSEGYDGDDFDNNKIGNRMRQGLQDAAKRAMGVDSATQGASRAGSQAAGAQAAGAQAAGAASKRTAAMKAAGARTAGQGAGSAGAASAGATTAKATTTKTAAAKAGAGKAAALGGSGMVAAAAAYKAKEMAIGSMGLDPW